MVKQGKSRPKGKKPKSLAQQGDRGSVISVVVFDNAPLLSGGTVDQAYITKFLDCSKRFVKWAYIHHTLDADMGGKPVDPHWHLAIYAPNKVSTAEITAWFGVVPEAVGKEFKVRVIGYGLRPFELYVEYFTHEDPEQQEKGKHRYEDSEVHANYNWVTAAMVIRKRRELYGEAVAKMDDAKFALYLVENEGMRAEQVRAQFPEAYFANPNRYIQAEKRYRQRESTRPLYRENVYLECRDTSLAEQAARALVFARFPNSTPEEAYCAIEVPQDIELGGPAFKEYSGQAAVIANDAFAVPSLPFVEARFSEFRPSPYSNAMTIILGSDRHKFDEGVQEYIDIAGSCRAEVPFTLYLDSETYELAIAEGVLTNDPGNKAVRHLKARHRIPVALSAAGEKVAKQRELLAMQMQPVADAIQRAVAELVFRKGEGDTDSDEEASLAPEVVLVERIDAEDE